MKREHYLELLTSVDVMNALNGGRTEPVINVKKHDNFKEMRVKVPGIDPETIQIEVNNNTVSVYYVRSFTSFEKDLQLPHTVYNEPQPYFVDVTNIHAHVEGRELVVEFPFNHLASGYHKNIPTTEE
ncbi:Hsp20/alpha crystallin family protein [Chryseolinea lacunae]|uniref:Hsp20/alpha crystallin family protein n=1 Tax=Chryseolinea lacunae TaxID=2801331 RepID=A0ABS1L0A3_9BACT|nr:Hsp20/alpha crystallin family protein [Chryseolinea lacunae]MBL0745139.1 Hsp20/alpha crystallin family protein [Chryseolinea lacunae]